MVRIATLNVWFDDKLREKRATALLEVIKGTGVDVCCLQEVVPEVAAFLISGLPGWCFSDPGDGSTLEPYGVMALAAPGIDVQFSFHELPTNMCRKLIVVQHRGIAIGTVHLESLANHPTRQAQLQSCEKILSSYGDALLVGDFNFDSERNFMPPHDPLENEALVQIMPEFVDLWPALRPERGLTFDSDVNPYIGKPEHMRYDRIVARLSSWRATGIQMFGHEPVDHLVELSPWELEHLERPPTPPRPRPNYRHAPEFSLEAFDMDSHRPSTPSQKTAPQSSTGHAQSPETPPRRIPKFFLSDHFGLIVTLAPVTG